MLKKLSLMLVSVLMMVSFAGCGGGNSNVVEQDKTPIPLPEELMFADVKGMPDTSETSRVYFETDDSLENIQEYYKTVLTEDLHGEIDIEYDQEALFKGGFLVETEDSEGSLVWVMLGTYGEEKTPCAVVVAEKEGTCGVMVGVGVRARLVAQQFDLKFV